ncbi:MAG: M28 family peptidase [Bacteroidales bacterium]|nr:M28 family peptidase [Bacteroidales bacterium]
MRIKINYTLSIILCILLTGCNQGSKEDKFKEGTQETQKTPQIKTPDFDKDSAYYFVKQQVDFGPRVPNTKEHKACGEFLLQTLQRYADTVIYQPLTVKAYDGTVLNGGNIIGIFNPHARKRILLAAHWDSRPYADHDPNPDNHRTPIDGANDGASGVGVLLEIARQLHLNAPETGIDIIFFDLEDYGEPENERFSYSGENWCLGSQAWAKNPHVKNYRARYGILLDMVGGEYAQFTKEGISRQYAPDITDKIWNRANMLGFASYFQNKETNPIIDDHLYINRIRNIPTVDIIEWNSSSGTGFNKHWHTVNDNMNIINKETLSAVGKVVLSVIYNEK